MEKEKKFEAFFKENYTPFYFFALQFTNDEEVSKDIVNDSFELAWTKIDSIDVKNWKSYLLSYIRNKCVDYIRHQEVKKKYVDFYQKLILESRNDGTPEYDERILQIRKIIQNFSPQTKLIFQECYLREKKYKEDHYRGQSNQEMVAGVCAAHLRRVLCRLCLALHSGHLPVLYKLQYPPGR